MVKIENRACRGIRLVTETIKEGMKEYIYEIGWHVSIGKFYLEESITHLDRGTYNHPTFGGHVGYSDHVIPLVNWIKTHRNIDIVIVDETELGLEGNERYCIDDGERVLKKYPKWKTPIPPEQIIA
jgi:hypothetical protein